MKDWRFWFAEQRGTLLALTIFVLMFTLYVLKHPAGLTANVVQTAANKGVLLALVATAQTFVVLTAGIDLSVGAIFILSNCVASYVLVNDLGGLGLAPWLSASIGVLCVLIVGALCGMVNALIVIYGRLQPIVATIATGAVFFGLALWIRPFPGGSPDYVKPLGKFMTSKLFGTVPASMVFLLVLVILVWMPFRRSTLGRTTYAVGSSEVAAFMSGLKVKQAKFFAYVFSGLFASMGGIYLTFVTSSGAADSGSAGTYTLNSIAAVVLGGVALFGGRGSAIGAILGALAFLTIKDLLFVFDFDPLWQPLFEGIVLVLAVSIGSARLFQVRNRLDVFG
jgi:ribose transport system permease protein